MTFTRSLLALLFAASALASPTPTPSATPKPSYRFSVEKGAVTLSNAKSGAVLLTTSIERWGRPASTQDQLRHVALDVTATAVAGDRMGRERRGGKERMVDPNSPVYTIADIKKNKASYVTATFEGAFAFVIQRDSTRNGRYEALIERADASSFHQ